MGKRVAVLVSGSGTNLQALLDHDDLGGQVVAVLSDRPGARGLERARAGDVPARCIDPAEHPDRASWEAALAAAIEAAAPDLVVLAGFMRILSPRIVRRWTCMNVHPSLLPAFPGARAVPAALAWGAKVTGVTVHLVDEEVDHGPIVAQEAVTVEEDDTVDTLHARIQTVEHRLLPYCVALHNADRLVVEGRRVRILR